MFLKLDLILIGVFLYNASEVKSDCDDFISCIGSWIDHLLVDDRKEVAVKAVEVPDVLIDVGDILTNVTHFIEDKFYNITKEISLVKNVENKTVIHVQTFKVDDRTVNENIETFLGNATEFPDINKSSNSEFNSSNTVVNNILINVLLHPKENQKLNIHEIKNDDFKQNTELSVTSTEPDNMPAGDSESLNKITLSNILYDERSKHCNDSSKMLLTKNKVNKEISVTKKNNTRDVESEDNYRPSEVAEKTNVTHKTPVNQTHIEIKNTSNNENQNSSNIFINIPQTVASNYKITFESPINVTYFEIITREEIEIATNVTDTNFVGVHKINDPNNNVINQNTEENEIIVTDNEFNYNEEDNNTDYLAIDYVELYKDTTNEDVAYTPPTYIPTTTEAVKSTDKMNETNGIASVFPWIVTLFTKNNENSQFEYICDGALVSNRVVLTAARCVTKSNVTENVSDILVILGKRSLQETGPNEKVVRVKSAKFHENFTAAEGKVANDLAIIVLDESIVFNDDIQPVPLEHADFAAIHSATTGWRVTGQLTPIYFVKESGKLCKKQTEALYTFCATFGDDVTTCPSYGGLYVARRNETDWGLQGIASGNPTNKGVCFNKHVTFTNISFYYQWIMENVDANKVK